MKVKFQLTEDDYNKFIKSYIFKKDLGKRLFLIILASILIGNSRVGFETFKLSKFFLLFTITAIFLLIILILIPYITSKLRLKKTFKTTPLQKSKEITLSEDGFTISTENEDIFWKWEILKLAGIVDGYLFLILFTNKYYIIPTKYFSSENESLNFWSVAKNGILKVRGGNEYRKTRNLYYWGLIGFIPNFGFVAGVILTVKGFQRKDNKLILIGILDILFTIFFWKVIFPYLTPSR